MEGEIRRLQEHTELTRYRLLMTELGTCFTALDLAKFELALGDMPTVEKEISYVENASSTIQRFLPKVSAEQRTELEAKLAELKAALDQLKASAGKKK